MDEEIQHFLTLVENKNTSQQDLCQSAQNVLRATDDEELIDVTLEQLALGFTSSQLKHAPLESLGIVAQVCGTLIEAGGDVSLISDVLLHPIPDLLQQANTLLNRCYDQLAGFDPESFIPKDDFENPIIETLEELSIDHPAEKSAWDALHLFYQPVLSVLSVDPIARQQSQCWLKLISDRFAEAHQGAFWLRQLLNVLDNQTALVLLPEIEKGFQIHFSGIAENSHLLLLMMSHLIGKPHQGLLNGEPLSEKFTAIANGDGPASSSYLVDAPWQLFSYRAITSNGVLLSNNDELHEHAIWLESSPNEIPMLNDQRILILKTPVTPRAFHPQRIFPNLLPVFEVTSQLSNEQVNQQLQHLSLLNLDL